MSYLRKQDYTQERIRPKILSHYMTQMKNYLQLRHPHVAAEVIEGFIKEQISERFKSPMVNALVHKREGQTEEVDMRLDHYVRNIIADNNLSPSGSSYQLVSRKESFLRISIRVKVQERNDFKHLYLDYEAQGMKRESQYYYQNQANAKIFNNAIAGGMQTRQFILGDKAGFNAITSAGRMCVKQGYSYIERAVNGNIYLPSVRDALSYALNHARHIPQDFVPLITNLELYIPTVEDVVSYLLTSVKNYTHITDSSDLVTTITAMSSVERSYIFYAGCLNNLCRYNETLMRTWIDSCFIQGEIDPALYQDIDPKELKTFPGDVVNAVLATNYRRLGEHPEKPGRWNSLKDAAKFNPDGVKAFIYCCRHYVKHFVPQLRILTPILQLETTFSKLTYQDRMARYTVPLSDTDSNIFSTQELIRWKRGKIDFTQESYEMNAITVFMLSQALEHMFARLSAGFGVEQEDMFRISMKNEFLYPVAVITSMAKHYLAIATMQEGSLLPNPRKDIKGVNLRSSAWPKLVRDTYEAFVVDLFKEIQKGEPIRAAFVLQHVVDMEQKIFTSVSQRESDYLQTTTIRVKEDYSDPMSSSYFYYELWKDVFAEEMGEMPLPNKCYKIPLKKGGKILKDPVFMEKFKAEHPVIHDKLLTFLERQGGRTISSILVPPSKGPVNALFIEMMDIRSHISQIMMGYNHLLVALGIGTQESSVNALVSDYYDPTIQAIE